MKFQVIVCDPAWGFRDGLKKMKRPVRRSAASQYRTMTPAHVAALPVAELADPNGCLLALWVPGCMLEHGLAVMHAWGFELKQLFVWVKLKKGHADELDPNRKTRVGMGRLFRQSHEVALVCTSGRSVYPRLADRSQRSVAFDLNVGHSCKPATLQRRLEAMFPDASRVELFARRPIAGWVTLGDAIDGKDIDTSIHELASMYTAGGAEMKEMKFADSVWHRVVQIVQEAMLTGVDCSDLMRQVRVVPDEDDPHVLVLSGTYERQVKEMHDEMLKRAREAQAAVPNKRFIIPPGASN